MREAGNYSEGWNRHDGAGMRVARGVYFVRLSADRVVVTRRLVLLHS